MGKPEKIQQEGQLQVGSDVLLSVVKEGGLEAAFQEREYGEFDAEHVAKIMIRWLARNGHGDVIRDITDYSLNAERRSSANS